jgi:hypothetical protein
VGWFLRRIFRGEFVFSGVLSSNFQIKGFVTTFPVLTSAFTTSMTGFLVRVYRGKGAVIEGGNGVDGNPAKFKVSALVHDLRVGS